MDFVLKSGNEFYGGDEEAAMIAPLQLEFPIDKDYLPVSGGRSSQPEGLASFAPKNRLLEIPPDFSIEWLTTLENLAAYQSDISLGLDNIVQLANTPHDIYFSDKVKPKMVSVMKKHLIEREKTWYQNSSGMFSLKADLLSQIVINGALSAEAYPDKKMKGIYQVVKVSPKYIRFVYNSELDTYDPYQRAMNSAYLGTSTVSAGLIPLNKKTYSYISLRRFFQTPYATPPFISAVDALCVQKDMLDNFKNIMKKLGMLGFLSAEVSPPPPVPGENQQQYWQRCIDYLSNTVYPQIEKNLGKGIVAGFKDKHTFNLQGNNMNVQGADGLFGMVQARIFAAIKQDPNMNGVNNSTTETFGRVILAKMLSQTRDYQQIFDSFIEKVYYAELILAGFDPGFVKVVSQKPMVGDKVKDEQAESGKIKNVKMKRDMGIISQEIAANELGYEEAYAEGDITRIEEDAADPNNPDGETNPDKDKTDPAKGSNAHLKRLEYILKKHVTTYDYCNDHECGENITKSNFEQFDGFKGTDLDKYINRYFNSTNKAYKNATAKISETLGKHLLNYNENTRIETIQREAYMHVLSKWENEFVMPMKSIVQDNITRVWEHFRKDRSIFESGTPKGYAKGSFANKIPDGVLDLDDFRAIEYMESSDEMYLGKFITDGDTKRAIYKYLQEEYLEGYLPIGNNQDALSKFQKKFGDMLNLEAWKIRRIIDTTMNKVRNYAHVMYMEQASVDKYEVIEMLDRLTCAHCEEMNGKIFTVKASKERIMKEVSAGPENVSAISPFLTSIKLDDLRDKSDDEISAMGFNAPPYHPHCRGTLAAAF